jgi:hypothetical protein
MSETTKTIGISGVTSIVAFLLVFGAAEYLDDNSFSLDDYINGGGDVYQCVDRNITWPCQKLSSYYGLPNGKCWNDVVGNKLCRSGWDKINIDVKPSTSTGKKWNCSAPPKYECEEI